ncbi:MAG: hypothetical protein P0111_04965 [Nitrospira sp.]|nr:hypothetical protein [Nitrospira sp.]
MPLGSPENPPKIQVTPKEIAFAFIDFIVKGGNAKVDQNEALASLPEGDRESIRYESMLLIGWINEYATWDLFRNEPEQNAILTVYYSFIDALAQKDPTWHTFDSELRKRIPVYAAAARDGLQKSQFEQVGWEFARFCGHPDDTLFQVTGTMEFVTNCAATLKFLSGLNVAG